MPNRLSGIVEFKDIDGQAWTVKGGDILAVKIGKYPHQYPTVWFCSLPLAISVGEEVARELIGIMKADHAE